MLALAGGLTLLVAVVAVASRGEGLAPASGGGASSTVRDYLLSTYLVVAAVFFVFLMYVLVKERESLPTRRGSHTTIRQLVQFGGIMLALFVVAPYIVKAFRGDRGDDRPNAAEARDGRGKRGESEAKEDAAQFRWAPLLALGGLGLVSLAVIAGRRATRRDERSETDVADALAAVLDDALADLRADHDLRRATIAAYARMEKLLAAHDIPRQPSEAPFEYLSRVLLELRTSASAVFELTALFERAKFSAHAIDESMRDEAIAALATVRDELRREP